MNLKKINIKHLATFCCLIAALAACNNHPSSDNAASKTSSAVATKPGNTVDSLMNAMTGDTTASNAIAAEPETSSAAAANSGTVTVKKSIALKHPVIAKDNDGVYSHAEVDPVFPGGQIALDKYFDNNIKFPKAAVNADRVARVVVSFVVDENGAVSDVKDIGRKAGYGFDEEAVRVVYNMPKWAPGTVGGKPVKTRMTLPVFFRPKK